MRRTLFRRLMQEVPAVYYSDGPLFAFSEGSQPLAPGIYRAARGESKIRFAVRDSHYAVSGDATPETVALIAAPAHPGLHIFQQSGGLGTTFYGAFRLHSGGAGFRLFSPEGDEAAALDAAVGHGATPTSIGYKFADRASLLAALIPLAQEAQAAAWQDYRAVSASGGRA
ncbi:MAG: hypothetical protein V4574_08150 [Pseudomonadota bacterium]